MAPPAATAAINRNIEQMPVLMRAHLLPSFDEQTIQRRKSHRTAQPTDPARSAWRGPLTSSKDGYRQSLHQRAIASTILTVAPAVPADEGARAGGQNAMPCQEMRTTLSPLGVSHSGNKFGIQSPARLAPSDHGDALFINQSEPNGSEVVAPGPARAVGLRPSRRNARQAGKTERGLAGASTRRTSPLAASGCGRGPFRLGREPTALGDITDRMLHGRSLTTGARLCSQTVRESGKWGRRHHGRSRHR